ncbi:predicted protein [Aspergillus terreus NIH2624]|uniref:Uncharacterized protein n=1 Tax=Aspergillus terreus (strain NIH 2624 / FGSC A1156) TaxID=341663 RepID=Q0CE03_ASPTN|nr:uncharacterized protein ATEG_08081 [Aspergillus terreus NIH2624]EAU31254.1 predicted protein [Aspergillus terreus NIH2624]
MSIFQTLFVLYLWVWTLPATTLARPYPTSTTSPSLLCTTADPSLPSAIDTTPTASTLTLLARERPAFKRSRPRRKGRGGIPPAAAILLPIIILFLSMTSILLCARIGSRKGETRGQVWGDSAVDNQTRQEGEGQPPPLQPPARQQQQDLELSEIDEAPPPPYSREAPK